MPILSANLSMMYKEYPFLDRFSAAANDGFRFVEYLFPYDFESAAIAAHLKSAGVTQSLFNLPPGDWLGGERGIAALPGREAEFAQGLESALEYAEATGCKRLHVMAGRIPLDGQQRPKISDAERAAMRTTYLANLRRAARDCASHGITTLIEPINTRDIPGYFINYQQDAHDIVDELGEPNLKVQMDFYHVQVMEGDIEMRLRKHFGHVGHVQIAGVPRRNEPDTGEVNYSYLLKLLDDLDYAGHVGCEYNPRAKTSENLKWATPWMRKDREFDAP